MVINEALLGQGPPDASTTDLVANAVFPGNATNAEVLKPYTLNPKVDHEQHASCCLMLATLSRLCKSVSQQRVGSVLTGTLKIPAC